MVLLHELILMLHQPYKWGSDQLSKSCSSTVGNVEFWRGAHKLTSSSARLVSVRHLNIWKPEE